IRPVIATTAELILDQLICNCLTSFRAAFPRGWIACFSYVSLTSPICTAFHGIARFCTKKFADRGTDCETCRKIRSIVSALPSQQVFGSEFAATPCGGLSFPVRPQSRCQCKSATLQIIKILFRHLRIGITKSGRISDQASRLRRALRGFEVVAATE